METPPSPGRSPKKKPAAAITWPRAPSSWDESFPADRRSRYAERQPKGANVRARGADPAFEAFYRRHVQRVAGVVAGIVRHPSEVEDVTQEAFLKIFRHRDSLGGLENEPAWVTTLARRCALDHIKRRRRRAGLEVAVEAEAPAPPAADEKLALDEVRAAIARLSADDRALLERVVEGGEDSTSLARELGNSPAGVRGRLKRLRDRLRQWTDPGLPEADPAPRPERTP
jgi:RNA polymerase sigma-70 factor (ECF subfamily)